MMRERRKRAGTPRSQAPILRIETLGPFAIRAPGEVALQTRKAAALIGYLALADDSTESRERLVGLLWSETGEDKARASLRQALHGLRAAFAAVGSKALTADKVAVTLDRAAVRVDLWDVIAAAKAGRAHRLLLERRRPIDLLLRDFETLDAAYRIWLLATRQALHDRLTRLLERVLREAATPEAARDELARALLNLDPTHEEAARLRMRARAAAGDFAAALRIYKDLWDVLEAEYDIEPSEETQALVAALRMQPPGERPPGVSARSATAMPAILPPAAAPAPASDVKPMIAVHPFELAAAAPAHHYLVHGFRRELIACLVRFREWFVREPTPLPTGSASVDDYQIEGAAFEAQDAMRLVLTLRDLRSNRYLWSERVHVSMEDWFDAQQVIVRRLATALNVHLSAERLAVLAHQPIDEPKAYDLWLQGQAMLLSFDRATWEKAADTFREAIELYPNFAPAYSSLAQQYNAMHHALPGVFRDRRRIDQALTYAREAARLDPVDSRSQLCLAWSHAMARQHNQATIFLRLAEELNENDPWTMISAANCFAQCGEYERARRLADYALQLPLTPSPLQWAYHTVTRFVLGDYPGCVAAADLAGESNTNVPGLKAAALHHLGAGDAARLELDRLNRLARARWVGQEPPSDASIARWFLQLFPIGRGEDWERLRDGLAGAGAPTAGASQQW